MSYETPIVSATAPVEDWVTDLDLIAGIDTTWAAKYAARVRSPSSSNARSRS